MENQKEIWKDIPNYDGLYQASNLGRVKSLKRFAKDPLNGTRIIKERILKEIFGSGGYCYVCLSKNGRTKTMAVHRIMALTFFNHNSKESELVIDHIDNVRKNNYLNNLQVITVRENTSKDRCNYTSDYVGVSWDKKCKKWRSQIYINGKQKYLGRYKSELEASIAYQNKLKEINDSH
jgi:hypothetical protein